MRAAVVAVAALFALSACSVTPPPPLVPSTPGMTIVPKEKLNEVVVGVDDVKGSYNPHTLAGQSTVTTALSSLLLPSTFRPNTDGSPRIDLDLLVGAEVTKAEPYTVTYTIRRDASWSDSAPIAAEDFVYLWERMRAEPGVVDPAGYRLIDDIASREGGKVVEVVFGTPYPGWRSLFANLLPAHLLKDAPGGWAAALTDSFPATAGPFAVRTLDQPRGEIILERNDRFWERPTALDRVVLRRASQHDTVEALKTVDDQAALIRADAIALKDIEELARTTSLTTSVVPRPEVVQVLARPAAPQMADVRVRQAVLNALDRDELIAIGSHNGPSAQLKADSQVVPPTKAGYLPTYQPNPTPPGRLLAEAGYTQQNGQWVRDGKQLVLTIAAPAGVEPYVTIASQVQRQLSLSGIAGRVLTTPPNQLFGRDLAGTATTSAEVVDIAVVPRVDTGDSAATLASTFGCRTSSGDGGTPIPANLSGFCDQSVQTSIEDALTGRVLLSDALARIEPVLWQQAVALPLFQVADLLVALPQAQNVTAGAPFAGPLSGAATWRREGR
ncbi:ABC-type transport system substrate-binding protein [Saccharothrix tamanrassetensis]|uniref:ABC-type transport system substrate-binding protein n=1 Tax=Saccharothrix tamanrassetensis TaxID=1051531 RepID=A0A841CGU0_9PSEU|nr:ABC transporter family substrate-binding protein [Saccharothrix tamanrassetensis]MBB5956213.1 ABC-type transport system substrate-binding protein [Saccharothrix tamanrassetensis]